MLARNPSAARQKRHNLDIKDRNPLTPPLLHQRPASELLQLDQGCIADEIDAEKTQRGPMPFYLVTQTLLVEAENDEEAAEKAATRIHSGEKVTVSVKADETSITHITVAAAIDSPRPVASDCRGDRSIRRR